MVYVERNPVQICQAEREDNCGGILLTYHMGWQILIDDPINAIHYKHIMLRSLQSLYVHWKSLMETLDIKRI